MPSARNRAGQHPNRSILNFFRPFTIPQERRPNNNTPREGIVVASSHSSQSGRSSRQPSERRISPAQHSQAAPVNVESPRRPGRPRKSPTKSQCVPQSSASDSSTAPKKRGRPRKSDSQQARDEQLKESSESCPVRRSPRRSPLRYNVNPGHGAAAVTPTRDSPYRSASDTPSKRRVAVAVEVPSSEAKPPVSSPPLDAPPIPTPASIARPPVSTANTTSFSSTLSSVFTGSQASTMPVSSNSKRIISAKDGLKGVTNSDSDDSGSSSDGELADMSTLFDAKRRKLAPSVDDKPAPTSAVPKPGKKSTRLSDQDKRQKKINTLPRSPPRKVLKHSLANLIAQHEKDQMAQARIASLESSVDEAKKREERLANAKAAGINGIALIEAAGSDSDERQRMITALDRTEALHDEVKYHFFLDDKPLYPRDGTFPELDNVPWEKLFRNAASRTQACVSGFAAELVPQYPLPARVVRWMTQELLYESDETLCEAYVEILRVSSAHQESLWRTSASLNSLYKTRSIFEFNYKDAVATANLPPGLRHIVRVAAFSAPACDSVVTAAPPQDTSAALLDLALMNIDDQVKDDPSLSLTVLESIEDMLDALPEDAFHKLVEGVVSEFRTTNELSLELRCRAIVALPAATPRVYRLRRRLASECFSDGTNKKNPSGQDWSLCIVEALKHRHEFHINEETDFGLLLGLISVLDIAISSGWTDYEAIIPGPSTGPWNKPAEPTQIERRHNDQMDAICRELERIQSRIRNAGTTHIRRTQAKTAIEHLIGRLENDVRARAKFKKGVLVDKKSVSFGQARFGARGFTGPGLQTPGLPTQPHVESQRTVNTVMRQDVAHTEVEAGPSTPPRQRERFEQADEIINFSQDMPSSPPVPIYNGGAKASKGSTVIGDGDVNMVDSQDDTDETMYYDTHSQPNEDAGGS